MICCIMFFVSFHPFLLLLVLVILVDVVVVVVVDVVDVVDVVLIANGLTPRGLDSPEPITLIKFTYKFSDAAIY